MKIRITPPDGAPWELDLPDVTARVTIGRGDDCAVTLPERTVSRRHTDLYLDETGTLMVRDGGSRYGTLLNGRLIRDPSPFYHGDVLNVGGFVVELCGSSSEPLVGAPTTPLVGMDTRRIKKDTKRSQPAITSLTAHPRGASMWIFSWLWVVLLLAGLILLGILLVDYLGGTDAASEGSSQNKQSIRSSLHPLSRRSATSTYRQYACGCAPSESSASTPSVRSVYYATNPERDALAPSPSTSQSPAPLEEAPWPSSLRNS